MNKYIRRDYFTINDLGITADDLVNQIDETEQDLIAKKLVDLILLKFGHCWVKYKDIEINPADNEEPVPEPPSFQDWIDKFKYIYITTQDKYKFLIQNYESQRDNLLGKIHSKTVSRFNDTPQESGDFATDGFNNTVNLSESETDYADVMTKLDRVQTCYRKLYNDWVEEFWLLFGGVN